ncbi:DCC1-like thiol-disulfide oxidoreductase family protein [Halarcobacter sp.]|uniref:DCC1-like thiol-disulfide oxidoreductase family protein n=1 Tax=Halarcobacter sp. TaxID=2321133 RepID=UPI003A94BC43
MKIDIYYDKECPFCNKYAQILNLRKEHDVSINNARDDLEKLRYFYAYGYDINNGIIVQIDEKIYQGSDAIIAIDNLSENSSFFYKTKIFQNFLYPVLKIIRKIVLFILGRNSNIKFEE